jgi:aminomethyltransferase
LVNDRPETSLRETLLAEAHRALGARMVPFAGYEMPVQYPTGIIAEHMWTRDHAGLFDVSHMGPSFLELNRRTGDADADHAAVAALIEPLICGDIRGLKPGQIRYTLMLNDDGGILDDLMIARPADTGWSGVLYIVVNAGTKDGDFARIEEAAGDRAELRRSDDHGLLALQGPEAADVIAPIVHGAGSLGFMTYSSFVLGDSRVVVSRSGYTGEDGFELLVPPEHAVAVWKRLLQDPRVKPIGLGARDSLRLEAGLPLYGHDLDESTSPVEADLLFAISKRRREAADFPGADRILGELRHGPQRKRVGIRPEGKTPAREGTAVSAAAGKAVGRVTSGGFGPSIGGPVAMGYVETAASAPGTPLMLSVRGKDLTAAVAPLPFVPHRYFRKPAPPSTPGRGQ